MTATWEEPITFLPTVAACPVKYCIPSAPQGLQKLGHEGWGWTHWRKSVCTELRSRLPHYGPTSRSGKNKIIEKNYLIPLISPLRHNWACCTVKRSTNVSDRLAQWNWASVQAAAGTDSKHWFWNLLRIWGWTKRDFREMSSCHLLVALDEVLLPTQTLSMFCCSSTTIIPA